MSKWYDIKALAADGTDVTTSASEDKPATRASISIFDEIGGWGITAREFIAEFNTLPADIPIDLSIHSPGGNAFEALAIYHVLASARTRLTAQVVGVAASAATLPLMAAGKRIAPANAYIMVHNPIMFSRGDAEELREVAALLDQITGSMANIYATNTGAGQSDILKMMDDETWMDGAAAAKAGFIHEVTDAMPVLANLSESALARFGRVPQALLVPSSGVPTSDIVPSLESKTVQDDPRNAPVAMPADEVASACLAAGESALAPLMIRAQLDAESVARRLSEAQEIRAIAAAAGRADDAQALIAAGSSIAHARAQLLAARSAALPAIRPHSRSGGDAQDGAQANLDERLSVHNIYARRKTNAPTTNTAAHPHV